ncbi:lactate dehydrogenase [Pseudomonas aeruginosa]|nr:lactate dehydrogenase [Pseudomonas aeruginosa]
MNYRHAYHAGNHADVFKHLVLARIFALLGRKDTPYAYLDSHSGVGLYDLQGDEASRTGEWEQGIARLWEREGLPEQLDDYLDVIRHLNPDGSLRYYPGSPELARRLTRAQDRVLLNELHPEDGRLLKANMAGERRVAVHQGDGWLLPRAFLRQTVVVIWYPIKDERQLKRFYQALERSVAPKLLRAELHVHPIDDAERFNGSGLAIVNPPWPLEDELRDLLPWLAEVMAQSQGGWRLDWLVAE